MNPTPEHQISQVSIDLIDDPQLAMRTELEIEPLQELANDIKRNGLIEPIILRVSGDRYEVVAGHRRTAACKIAGMVKIPAVIRTLTDDEALAIKVSENFVRSDIDPVDEALFFAELTTTGKLEPFKLAELIGRTEDYVRGRLDLLLLPPDIIQALKTKQIKLGVARQLGQITDEKDRLIFLEYAIKDGVTEYAAKNWYNQWYYNSKTNPQQTVADYTPQEIREIARPKLPCAKCGIASDIRELVQVFIHNTACENYVEALHNRFAEPTVPEPGTAPANAE